MPPVIGITIAAAGWVAFMAWKVGRVFTQYGWLPIAALLVTALALFGSWYISGREWRRSIFGAAFVFAILYIGVWVGWAST